MLCPSRWEPAWRLHTNSYNLGKTFIRISRTRNIPDLNLGELLCIYTSFHFPDSGLYLSNGFDFFFYLFWRAWHWKPAREIFLGDFTDGEQGKGKGVSKGAGVFVFCPPISLTNPITSIVNRWPITSRGASRHGPNLLTFFYTGNCQVVQLSPYKPFRVFRSSFKSAYDFVENLRVQLIKFFE